MDRTRIPAGRAIGSPTRTVVAWTALAALLTGCGLAPGAKGGGPQARGEGRPRATPTGEGVVFPVELVSAGARPRQVLSLGRGSSYIDSLSIEIASETVLEGASVPLPGLAFDVRLESAGFTNVFYRITGPELLIDGVDPAFVTRAYRRLDGDAGATGWLTYADNGGFVDWDIAPDSGIDRTEAILLRSGMAELLVMFPPFPTAPAGEGARWRAQFGGVAGPVVVDYVLTRLDGHRFTVTATFDASAFAGVPGMTPIAHHAAEETARMVIEGTTRESSVRRATSTYTLEVDVPRSGGETLPLTQSAELVLR